MIRPSNYIQDVTTIMLAVLNKFFSDSDKYNISSDFVPGTKYGLSKTTNIMFYNVEETGEVHMENDSMTASDGTLAKGQIKTITAQIEIRTTSATDDELGVGNGVAGQIARDLLNKYFRPTQRPSFLETEEGLITVTLGETTYTDKSVFDLGILDINIGTIRQLPVENSSDYQRYGCDLEILFVRAEKAFSTYTI